MGVWTGLQRVACMRGQCCRRLMTLMHVMRVHGALLGGFDGVIGARLIVRGGALSFRHFVAVMSACLSLSVSYSLLCDQVRG